MCHSLTLYLLSLADQERRSVRRRAVNGSARFSTGVMLLDRLPRGHRPAHCSFIGAPLRLRSSQLIHLFWEGR